MGRGAYIFTITNKLRLHPMRTTPAHNIAQAIANVEQDDQPTLVTSERGNAILISQSHWESLQETLYLNSIPGLAESVQQAAAEPIEND